MLDYSINCTLQVSLVLAMKGMSRQASPPKTVEINEDPELRELTRDESDPIAAATEDLLEEDHRRTGRVSVPLLMRRSGLLMSLANCCSGCACGAGDAGKAGDAAESSSRKTMRGGRRKSSPSKDGLVFRQGYLWKVNHEVCDDATLKQLANVRNWRRRNFYVVQNGEELVMVYISEKENGHLQLGVTFDASTKVEVAPDPVLLGTISQGTQDWARTGQQQYDIAFMGEKSMKMPSDYEVPSELYIITIHWQDRDEVKHKLILGTDLQTDRDKWLRMLRVRLKINFGEAWLKEMFC